MDFAKAFDKISHRRLLYKLEYYGIQTHTLNWIQAFLSDRTQTVVIDGVTSGVPQGTVLCPILFLIYINDFPEYLTHSKLRLFADDSIIYKEITCQDDCKKLQSDLDAAARWEADWLMAFHPDHHSKENTLQT
jgi:retron-type reverse transcriptase